MIVASVLVIIPRGEVHRREVADAADGKALIFAAVVYAHISVVASQVTVIRAARVARVLRNTPEVGVFAREVERRPAASACRNCSE